MNQYLEKVKEFMVKFGQDLPIKQNIDDKKINALRVDLISEETRELNNALTDNDKVETLDALCDLQYVLSGAILAFGFQDVFEKAFEEVHRSNMSKACFTQEDAKHTKTTYENMNIKCEIEPQDDGTFFVKRTDNKKILKSIQYSAANLKQFIQ